MNAVWEAARTWLGQQDDRVVIALASAAGTAILMKYLPYLLSLLTRLLALLGRLVGGRFAYRDFEARYLNWLVADLRELRLTGIVSYDQAKKPQLEQVFVSLCLGKDRQPVASSWHSLCCDRLLATDPTSLSVGDRLLPFAMVFQRLVEAMPLPLLRSRKLVTLEFEVDHTTISHLTSASPYLRASPRLGNDGPIVRLDLHQMSQVLRILSEQVGPKLRRMEAAHRESAVRVRMWVRASDLASLSQATLDALRPIMARDAEIHSVLRRWRRIAVLGGPGSGKSTLLQYLALTYARERAGDRRLRRRGIVKERLQTSAWQLPVFLQLVHPGRSSSPVSGIVRVAGAEARHTLNLDERRFHAWTQTHSHQPDRTTTGGVGADSASAEEPPMAGDAGQDALGSERQ